MITPDSASGLRAERRFDIVTIVLIGVIAILAAILSVIQMDASQASNRANLQAARVEADLSARISVSNEALNATLGTQQLALMLEMDALSRGEAGVQRTDDAAIALGKAEQAAYDRLKTALDETSATSGGKPLDPYAAGLLRATLKDLQAELREQNRQVDIANASGSKDQLAILGLSCLALGGVLTGLAAVLREGRSGNISLSAACAMAAAAGLLAILAFV